MAILSTCPGCGKKYQLSETMRGKKVRCKSCSETFFIRGESHAPAHDDDDKETQAARRPAKRVVAEQEDEDTGPPRPRRRSRRKDRNAVIVPLIIAGCIIAGVLVLALGGIAIWALARARQSQPAPVAFNANPPARQPAQAAVPPAQPPAPAPIPPPNLGNVNPPPAFPPANPPQPQMPVNGPIAVELTNAKVSGFGAHMQVSVDYRFTSGNPEGKRLLLLIKATKAGGLRQNYYLAELRSIGGKTEGTINAAGMSFGIENGPFEMWMGEGPVIPGLFLSDRDVKKISNVVTVGTKEFAPPGMRPPFGPR